MFFTKSQIVLDDSPWKIIFDFKKVIDIFEYVRHFSYHQDGLLLTQPRAERKYASFFLRQDDTSRTYTRKTYDILVYLGFIGGINALLYKLIGFTVGFLIKRQFNQKLVSDLYKVQQYSVDQSEYYKTDKDVRGPEYNLPEIPEGSIFSNASDDGGD